jgi:hypothetical protein
MGSWYFLFEHAKAKANSNLFKMNLHRRQIIPKNTSQKKTSLRLIYKNNVAFVI